MAIKGSLLIYFWLKLLILLNSHEGSLVSMVYAETVNVNAGGASSTGMPPESIGKLRSTADQLFTSGQLDKSIEVWSKVIVLEPSNENNFYKRFRVYLRQQKYKEALADLTSVISINPGHENAIVQRAKLHLKLGKCGDAATDFDLLKR